MKKIVAILATLMLAVFLSGCAGDVRTGGKVYQSFGVINEDAKRQPDMKYSVSFGSVVVGVLFIETIIVPIYVVGWDLYEAQP